MLLKLLFNVETCAPMKRGLKAAGRSCRTGMDRGVETCAPMKRGLKVDSFIRRRGQPRVETCAPMKRGLKDAINEVQKLTIFVETCAPMKRGLKVFAASSRLA